MFFRRLACLIALLPTSAMALTTAPDSCTPRDFGDFLTEFTAAGAPQARSTADMVTFEALDPAAEPEPAMQSTQTPKDQLTWPVMPALTDLMSQGLEVRIDTSAPNGAAVVARGADNGTHLTWVFDLTPCWQLTKVIDASL